MSGWGVRSASGIVTEASRGEEQARKWAAYKHPATDIVREELVRHAGLLGWVSAS